VTIPSPTVNGYLASCNKNQSVPSPELMNWYLFDKINAGSSWPFNKGARKAGVQSMLQTLDYKVLHCKCQPIASV
jgi:hypothetical protein